ncbi:hypothetical protein BYT27DRAFT_7212689 [Phlegmacium glaucopus]|nr:hypothetical protein BYT27DRAFT_7212689 [Phlegmacium glaucopus]
MPLMPLGSTVRVTRAGAGKHWEDVPKTNILAVTDVYSAKLFLSSGEFKRKETVLSMENLSMIAMQLLQQSNIPHHATEAFKALSFLIINIHQHNNAETIMEMIAKSVAIVTKRLHTEIEDATDQLTTTTITINTTVDELQEECHNAMEGMKEAIEKAVAEAEAKREIETREHIRNKEHEEKAHTDTYADRTRRSILVSHAKEVVKAELQKWRVR